MQTYLHGRNLISDLDFAHDVCGDAAVYFDPWRSQSVRDAIVHLKSHPELGQALAAKGKMRLQTVFKSWDGIAEDVACWLEEIASLQPRRCRVAKERAIGQDVGME